MVKRYVPNVVRGGIAIPLGNNYYYMSGRKHSKGGIDIGKSLEVEDGELMKVDKDNIKVYSSVPFLDGESPAQKVINGEDANKVFNAQEQYKDINKLNDDGTKRKKAKLGIGEKLDEYADKVEPYLAGTSLATTGISLAAPNPVTPFIAGASNVLGAGIDLYQAARDIYKKDYKSAAKNGGEALLSLVGGKLVKQAAKTAAGRKIGKVKRELIDAEVAKRDKNRVRLIRKGLNDEQAANVILGNAVNAVENSTKYRDVKNAINEEYNKKKDKTKEMPNTMTDVTDLIDDEISANKDDMKPAQTPRRGRGDSNNNAYFIDGVEKDYILNGDTVLTKNRKAMGGLTKDNSVRYTLTSNGKSNVRYVPSTGGTRPKGSDTPKAKLGLKTILKEGAPDLINMVGNIVGSGISYGINKRALAKMKFAPKPVSYSPAKLRTTFNINPQLDYIRESGRRAERNVDANTGSSKVALARKQAIRLGNIESINKLYGQKENVETELINRDKLNAQQVAMSNVDRYNKYMADKAAFRNNIIDKKAENAVGFTNNITSSLTNVVNNHNKRQRDRRTILLETLSRPNLPIEVLKEAGVIDEHTYGMYKKSYGKN